MNVHPRSPHQSLTGIAAESVAQDVVVAVADLPRAALPDQKFGNNALHDLLAIDSNHFRIVEIGEQILGRIAESLQEDGDMDLAPPIDPSEQEILVVELEIEPRSPIRDDATGVDLLAGRADRRRDRRVVEDAGRPMQLRNDDALGSVDDEGSLLGHHGNFPEIDLLLLHIADRL